MLLNMGYLFCNVAENSHNPSQILNKTHKHDSPEKSQR
uniref:Uncharacterized protein n=1 Tax=Ralstonia solanacearum TaxID=305 RepID=A0A0S4TZW6_RALSL|nr:protein of unknown function [Ralstonia solanacearum]